MTELLEFLASTEGSLFVGGLLVALGVQTFKRVFGSKPGTDACRKRAVAVVAACIVGAASAALSGEPVTVGAVIAAALAALAGGTTLHALALRSPESKAPGKPQTDETI